MKPWHFFKGFCLPLSLICLSQFSATLAYADSAAVMPKGFYQIQTESRFFFKIDEMYNVDGKKEDIATPFNNPLTPAVESILGVSLPGVDLGTNAFKIKRDIKELEWTPAYGVTNRFTIGAKIFYFAQADTEFQGNVNTSTANFGLNPGAVSPGNPLGLAPLFVPGTQPVNIDDINSVLGTLGYKPLKDYNGSGFSDTKIGGRYQYYQSPSFRAAFTGGGILPTGKEDDPDNLLDIPRGNGAWGMFFELQQDLMYQRPGLERTLGFPVPGDFFINSTVKYDMFLPHDETLRVCPQSQPICSTKVRLDRNIGDVLRIELQPAIGVYRGVIFGALYQYAHKFSDKYSGAPSGVDVSVLEKNSSQNAHQYKIFLSLNSIPWVMEKKFPLPFAFTVSYRDRFAGDNFVNVSRYIGFDFVFYSR